MSSDRLYWPVGTLARDRTFYLWIPGSGVSLLLGPLLRIHSTYS